MRGRDFAELEAFVAVAEQRSFTRAAALLGVAPSTLSQTIRQLEERVDTALLTRTTRSVALTGAGAQLLSRVRPALGEIGAAMVDAGSARGKPHGLVRLHMPRPAYTELLQERLGSFHCAYPAIVLDLTIDDTLTSPAMSGYDLSVRLDRTPDPGVTVEDLGTSLRHVVVASPQHLAGHACPRTPADLVEHRCINWRQHGSVDPFHWRFFIEGHWTGVPVSGAIVVSHCDVALRAAMEGLGLAFVLEPVARAMVLEGRLVTLLDTYLPAFPGWRLCRPRHARATAATEAVMTFLRETAD